MNWTKMKQVGKLVLVWVLVAVVVAFVFPVTLGFVIRYREHAQIKNGVKAQPAVPAAELVKPAVPAAPAVPPPAIDTVKGKRVSKPSYNHSLV
jgi:heme/copper-type cytochrome/quinol oxidase subunit 2